MTGCWDGSLKVWNSATGEPIRELHSDPRVFDVVFTPDGKTLATAGGSGSVTLWDPETGKRLADIRAHSERCWSVTCSPDGKQLATASWDRSAKLWNLDSRAEIASLTLQP